MDLTKENYFLKLNAIKCETDKKQNLTYVSWSDAWAEVKKIYPDSNYVIYENAEGFPFWESKFGIDCKVGVTINDIEHIVRLPVMDGANKAMKDKAYTYKVKKKNWNTGTITEIEKTCNAATQFDINKTIQRAFAKAIAMHGIGLYVFRGEDLPEDSSDESDGNHKPNKNLEESRKSLKQEPKKIWFNYDNFMEAIQAGNKTEEDFKRLIKEDGFTLSDKAKEAVRAYVDTGEINKY